MSIRALGTFAITLFMAQSCTDAAGLDSILSYLDIKNLLSMFPVVGNRNLKNSDSNLNFTQFAAKYGHPAKEYVTYTKDGYLLKVFRLPGRRYKLPVLLFHGISDSSDTWIIRGKKSLAITLAEAGYDVWLGNVRGNKYSQGHISPNLDSNSTYWNFTFHDHGMYDLAATIDLVLHETGASKLNSIAHSQGTTMHFVLLSTKPEYNEKVNLFIALAPVAYLHHSPPPLATLLRALPDIYTILRANHKYELFTETSLERAFVQNLCANTVVAYSVCLVIMSSVCGYDLTEIGPAFVTVAIKHYFNGVSSRDLLHYGQVAIRERFAQFDYGTAGNLVAYNSTAPPQYELENVHAKVVLLLALNDFFCTKADVDLLRKRLPNVVRSVNLPRTIMNHLDFVWGENMAQYLFPYIFSSLERYSKE